MIRTGRPVAASERMNRRPSKWPIPAGVPSAAYAMWIWWWERNLSRESRLGVAAVLSVVLLAAGWTTAARLTSAHASSVDDPSVWATTVARTITVHAKRASVTPTRVVTRQVVRYKPSTSVETLVRTNVVTAERVVTRTAAVTRTIVDTHTRLVRVGPN